MRKITILATAVFGVALSSSVLAFTQATHKQIAIDAVKYMERHPDTTNFDKLKAAGAAAGYTVDQMANAIGQGAYDVDDFQDTFMCGAITGDCVDAPVFGVGSFIATYTAWWHFQNHTHGPDDHGNDLGGYDTRYMPSADTIDNAIKGWLINDHLDDGEGGMTGTCVFGMCAEDSEYDSYGITEKNYRLDSNSTQSMYEDFQDSPFQPIDNLGQYWYNQFLASPSFQTLGFSLHTTDLLQPHHVWVSSGNDHGPWELWVGDNYDNLKGTDADVTAAMGIYTPVAANNPDIRSITTAGGAYAYANGGGVLTSISSDVRTEVGQKVIPAAIAMVVNVLNHAADQFNTPVGNSAPFTKAIQNKWGCGSDNRCDDYLTFSGSDAKIHATDKVMWRFTPVAGKVGEYNIQSTWGCGSDARCDDWLTFSGTDARIDASDKIAWKLEPVSGEADTYYIRSRYNCDSGDSRCDYYLTFSGSDAVIHGTDAVKWKLVD